MKFKKLIAKRYSVRAYLPTEVEREKIDYILACAQLAPSACNFQAWHVYVITSEEAREVVQKSYPRDWMIPAPVYIVVCSDSDQSWKRPSDGKDFCDIDASIISQHICIAAESADLGTCWVCNYDSVMLDEYLQLPAHIRSIAIFPIGYIDTEKSVAPQKKRKELSDFVQWL